MPERERLAGGLGLGENEPDLRSVGLDAAGRRVVHLEHQLGTLGNPLGGSLGKDRGASPGAYPQKCVSRPARIARAVGIENVDDDVVDDRTVARNRFGGLHPAVFLEVGRDAEIDVGNHSLGRDVIGLGDLEDLRRACRSTSLRETSRGAGISLASPSGVPCSTQARSVARSWAERLRSLAKWPKRGSACQGGMRRSATTSRIIAECLRASS